MAQIDEGDDLRHPRVDAHRFGREFVVPDRSHIAAQPGAEHPQRERIDCDGDAEQRKVKMTCGGRSRPRQVHDGDVSQSEGAPGQPLLVQNHEAEDLVQAEGCDGEVMAADAHADEAEGHPDQPG